MQAQAKAWSRKLGPFEAIPELFYWNPSLLFLQLRVGKYASLCLAVAAVCMYVWFSDVPS